MNYFIDLDLADTIDNARIKARKYNLNIEVINETGAGGGWPYIRFIGKRNDLLRLILNDYDPEASNLNDYIMDIQEYDETRTCICDHCGAVISDDLAHFGYGAENKLCDSCYSKLTDQEKEDFNDFGELPKELKK